MRTALALSTALVSAATFAAAAPTAFAETPADSRITVRPSTYDPDQGEEFRLRGRMLSEGTPVPGVKVRVQTWRNGGWQQLDGAVVTTGDDGRYRVRIVLFQDGDRDLRVVANPEGDDIRTARKTTVVRVWDPAQR